MFRYIIPTVAGTCSVFLYIIVDGIFVGRGVGAVALGAVNLALPYTLMANAIAILLTIGGITITAIRLGRNDVEGANSAFMHATSASFMIAVIIMILGMVFSNQIATLSAANETFHDMTSEYIFFVSAFFLPAIISIILQGFVRNDGAPILVSIAVIIGTIMNIALDWLFIFPLQMGVKGAAIASGVGQIGTLVILLSHFALNRGNLRIKRFSVSILLFKKVLIRGLPEMISQFGMPVLTLCMNYILIKTLSDNAVSAFSIISFLTSFSIGIFFGISEGLQPLIGQSYGRKNEKDLKFYFHSGMLISFLSAAIVFLLLVTFKGKIIPLFNSDNLLLQITLEALPKFSWAYIVLSLNLMISTYLYSTKRTKYAVTSVYIRSLVLTPISITLLPVLFGDSIIWFTVGIAEVIGLIITVIILKLSEKDGIVFH